ncbi:MAG: I78 family peptidase inhibitor [Pseudomonadota bacterium]
MHVRPLLAAFLLASLAGCAQEPPHVPVAPPPPMIAGQCDDSLVQDAVGKQFNEPLLAQLKAKSRAERVRVVRPGQMVTMEFDAQRLTVDVDAQERVTRVRCS